MYRRPLQVGHHVGGKSLLRDTSEEVEQEAQTKAAREALAAGHGRWVTM